MSKNLKLSFILLLVFNAICIAWITLLTFFSGAGISFVAIMTIVGILSYIIVIDKDTRSRILDVFVLACLFLILEFVVFCAFEFGWYTTSSLSKFLTYQHVISILSIFYLAYVLFRFFSELSNKKFKFIEIILGNEKIKRKAKANKELTNGSLEEKPNHVQTNNSIDKETDESEDNISNQFDTDNEENQYTEEE